MDAISERVRRVEHLVPGVGGSAVDALADQNTERRDAPGVSLGHHNVGRKPVQVVRGAEAVVDQNVAKGDRRVANKRVLRTPTRQLYYGRQ